MDDFAMKTLDRALSQVRSHGDARSLARMLLRLTETPPDSDVFSQYVEEQILTLLIECERENNSEPRLANIYFALRRDLLAELQDKPMWHDLVENTTEIYRRFVLSALEVRLINLRLLQKIEAARNLQHDQAAAS
ncbi:MAG: hypothetical protein ACRDHZ_03975 [Ktedonobacteraceae bacterium]